MTSFLPSPSNPHIRVWFFEGSTEDEYMAIVNSKFLLCILRWFLPTVFVENVTIHCQYFLRPWLYFTLNILLQPRLVFHHNFYQLPRLRVTFHFTPFLCFLYMQWVIHQVNSYFPAKLAYLSIPIATLGNSLLLCAAGCWAAFQSSTH